MKVNGSKAKNGDYKLDIGVGRLPVKSVEEASTVVDKLIRYSSDPVANGRLANPAYARCR